MTVSIFEDRPETARGRMLHEALLAVHAHIRRVLTRVEQPRTLSSTGCRQTDCTRSSGR